jgi:polyphenol oxidase
VSYRQDLPEGVTRIRETAAPRLPALVHPGWAEAFPWLVQGTTTRGSRDAPFDLGLFSGGLSESDVRRNWSRLRVWAEARCIVHARQVHGSDVRAHAPDQSDRHSTGAPTLVDECDGHVTAEAGTLLAITTADCVPVFAVDPDRRIVGAVHAGWRGAAAGVLERGLEAMSDLGARPADLHVHFGPAICASCYEVGAEVFEALGRRPPERPAPIDLRGILADRAVAAGVRPERVTLSTHCTRCTGSRLFSHRGGDAHRQVGYIGIRL